MQAKVAQAMAGQGSRTPYFLEDDPIIRSYEILREVWAGGVSIKEVCQKYSIARSWYYENEERFIRHGVCGLFPGHQGRLGVACS